MLSARALSSPPVALARGCVDALIVTALVALFLITFVIRTFYIPSVSMVPTLQIGDLLLVDAIAYRVRAPGEGDVAVFNPPVFSGGNDFIKRVIGLPGDSISISNGTLYRNGAALREPYQNETPTYDLAIQKYDIYVNGDPLDPHVADIPPPRLWQTPNRVPAGFYFVLGDNRNYSDDSHVWGFVPRANFVGRAFLVLWPLGRLHVLAR